MSRLRIFLVVATLLFVSALPTAQAGPGQTGQHVKAADADAYAILTAPTSGGGLGTIMCINSDSDGTPCNVDKDDPIYVDMDGGGTVSPGDIRLTSGKSGTTTVGSPGSRVKSGDADCCSQVLEAMGASITFRDTIPTAGADGIRSPTEAVYLNTDGAGANVEVGDLPLSVSGTGTRVSTAPNPAQPLTAIPGAPVIRFWDKNGDGSYSAEDAVYLDMDANGQVSPGDIMLHAGTQSPGGSLGTVVTKTSQEMVGALLNLPGTTTFLFNDVVTTNGAYTGGNPPEPIWLDANGNGVVDAGDVRIVTGSGSGTGVGSIVDANDVEVTNPPTSVVDFSVALGTDFLRFYDGNSNGIFDPSDTLYLDTNDNGQVNSGDVRLSTSGGVSFGLVTGSPTDVGRPLIPGGGLALSRFRFQDADGSGTLTHVQDQSTISDAIFFDANNDLFISPSDIRISSNTASGGSGGVVTQTSADAFHACKTGGTFDFTAATLYYFDQDADGILDLTDSVYLSRLADTAISTLDIRLTAFTSSKAAGTHVRSGDTDQTTSNVVAVGAGTWMFYDNDGDTRYSIGDVVYIDLDNSGAVNVGDVRFVAQSGLTGAGKRVLAGDTDLSRVLTALPAIAYCVVDTDGDGSYSLDDEVYLDIRQAGTGPTVGDARLTGSGGSTQVGGTTGGGGGGGGSPPPPPANVPATISVIAPVENAYVVTGSTVTVTGTADGGSTNGFANGITAVTLTVNGAAQTVSGTTSWSASFTPPSDGTYTLIATVVPGGGSSVSTTRTVSANPTGTGPPPAGSIEAQLQALLQQNSDLSTQLNQTLSSNTQLQGQISNLNRQLANQTTQMSSLNTQLNQLREENARLQQQLREQGEGTNGTPGFEPLLALVAVGAALFLVRRRD